MRNKLFTNTLKASELSSYSAPPPALINSCSSPIALFSIEFVMFSEYWDQPRPGLKDSGRSEAPLELTEKLLEVATHVLAFLSKESKWTKVVADEAHQRGIPTYVYHLDDSE